MPDAFGPGGRGVSGGAKVPIPGVGQERGRCGKTGGGLGVGVTNSPVLFSVSEGVSQSSM